MPRVDEISTDFDADPRARYFEQARAPSRTPLHPPLHTPYTPRCRCVSATLAAKLLKEVRLPMDTEVKALDHKAIVQLAHLMKEVHPLRPPHTPLHPLTPCSSRT